MKYHTGRRFGLDEVRQSKIYWMLLDLQNEPGHIRDKVNWIIMDVGGMYAGVLRQAVLTRESVTAIALRTNGTATPIDPSDLAKMVKRVYIELDKTLP